MQRDITYLTPTIVPAQPGYRCVWFSVEGGVDEFTSPGDLDEHSEAVIAWVIRIGTMPVVGGTVEFSEPHVHPVLPSFSVSDRDFVVSPTGQWSRYERLFRDEAEARATWLDEEREAERHRAAKAKNQS